MPENCGYHDRIKKKLVTSPLPAVYVAIDSQVAVPVAEKLHSSSMAVAVNLAVDLCDLHLCFVDATMSYRTVEGS